MSTNLATAAENEIELVREVDYSTAGALSKSEIESQLDAAHRYPRNIKGFTNEAISLATLTVEIAESCMYSIPRDGKLVTGPSVRLAEICASAYGNMQYGARVVSDNDKTISAQGAAWDMQKNVRCTIEAQRRITGKSGRRFSDDMVNVTGAAACSIALRNAIFRVIPRAYIDVVYAAAKETAVGSAKSLASRRDSVIERLVKLGVTRERIFERLGKPGIEDVDLEDVATLIGLGTAIKGGEILLDDAFPGPAPAVAAAEGKRTRMGEPRNAAAPAQPAKSEPPPAGRQMGDD